MGKFAKAKKVGQISDKSRAARRAASPSLDLDKSLTSLKAPVDAVDYNPKTLGVHDGGISKKKNQKRMTRAQRLRHEKGLDRADQVIDILHTKRQKSAEKGKRTKDRAGDWEDLNKKYTVSDPVTTSNAFQAIQEDDDADDDEDAMGDDQATATLKAVNNQTISAHNMSRFELAPTEAEPNATVVSAANDEDIDEVL